MATVCVSQCAFPGDMSRDEFVAAICSDLQRSAAIDDAHEETNDSSIQLRSITGAIACYP